MKTVEEIKKVRDQREKYGIDFSKVTRETDYITEELYSRIKAEENEYEYILCTGSYYSAKKRAELIVEELKGRGFYAKMVLVDRPNGNERPGVRVGIEPLKRGPIKIPDPLSLKGIAIIITITLICILVL